ncbi:CYTH and CHAD domain-containing protein [Actinomycetospora termitidis]|uniref:CYTH and CHAD domain-containing protein n=1 Tax=Actinomycetospora termitidis TaxID=3053470 RepID=A0ABT7ME47_9PSEU|nr:CYTH and CHAD domain-containing protein [Actinomycetospora sp. Odt1-22]MDL5158726.1 CYTH and CHAD domain-containing protein [Actinomycetospora sp. Odt1-22]
MSQVPVTSAGEVERKFEAAGAETLGADDVRAVLDRPVPDEPTERLQEAEYWDTADLALHHDRVTLRRRTGGRDDGWHVKLPGSGDRREELHAPLTPAGSGPPEGVVALLRSSSRGRPVVPVAELLTRRREWRAEDADGRTVAELVVDQVTARTVHADGREDLQAWQEIEVELGPGAPDGFLDEVEERLAERGIRRSASASKVGRVLAGRAATVARAEPDEHTAAGVVLRYLAEQARALRHQDPLVRLDREDAVHQMRVAARRLRSALQGFGRVLARERTRGLTEELRWFAGELAPARDTEVMLARLQELLAETPPALVVGPVAAEVDRAFTRRGAAARERATTALDSVRYLALLEALDALQADPPTTGRASRAARRVLPGEVDRAHRRVVAAMDAADATPEGPERDVALHEARKKAKRLRYANEVAQPVLGKPARRLRKRMKAVQELLGVHQDTAVTRATLLELAGHGQGPGEVTHPFTLGLLYGAEQRRARDAEDRLPALWARVPRPGS